jgi:hypothetical protein
VTTTREHFGTTLATVVRLYADAEKRGDAPRAKAYAAAVEALLVAWPSDEEPPCTPSRPSGEVEVASESGWPVCERTLTGLGIVSERLEASAAA